MPTRPLGPTAREAPSNTYRWMVETVAAAAVQRCGFPSRERIEEVLARFGKTKEQFREDVEQARLEKFHIQAGMSTR